MNDLVVDPSGVLPHLLGGSNQPYATAVILRLRMNGGVSTNLFFHEAQNAVLMAERHAGLNPDDGREFLALLTDLIELHEPPVPDAAAVSLARQHRLTFYDAGFLALAQKLGAELATRDKELVATAPKAGVRLFEPPKENANA